MDFFSHFFDLTIVAKDIFAPNHAHFVTSAAFLNLYYSFTQKCAEYVDIHKDCCRRCATANFGTFSPHFTYCRVLNRRRVSNKRRHEKIMPEFINRSSNLVNKGAKKGMEKCFEIISQPKP